MVDPIGGVVVYEGPRGLVSNTDVDVMWVTYQNNETPEIIGSVAENGVHVISEKPIARTAVDPEDIAERANELSVTASSTMYYRRDPVTIALRDQVSEGFFGDVWTLDGRFNASQPSCRDTNHYLYDRETDHGGAFQWVGPHWIDVVPWIPDDPIMRMNAQFHDTVEADVEAGAVLQFEIESGTFGTYHAGYYLSDHGKDVHLELYGTEGQALAPPHYDSLQREPTVPLDIISEHPDWTAAPKWAVRFKFTYDWFPA